MAAMSVRRVSAETTTGLDPSWRDLYRAGGAAGLLAGAMYIVAAILVFTTPSVPTAGGAETLAIGVMSEALISVLGIAYAIYGVMVMVWFLVIGRQLYRLARDSEQVELLAS